MTLTPLALVNNLTSANINFSKAAKQCVHVFRYTDINDEPKHYINNEGEQEYRTLQPNDYKNRVCIKYYKYEITFYIDDTVSATFNYNSQQNLIYFSITRDNHVIQTQGINPRNYRSMKTKIVTNGNTTSAVTNDNGVDVVVYTTHTDQNGKTTIQYLDGSTTYTQATDTGGNIIHHTTVAGVKTYQLYDSNHQLVQALRADGSIYEKHQNIVIKLYIQMVKWCRLNIAKDPIN